MVDPGEYLPWSVDELAALGATGVPEVAIVTTVDGFPVLTAYRVDGVATDALVEALASRIRPPMAGPDEEVTIAGREVKVVPTPGAPTYFYVSGDVVYTLGGPAISADDVADLISQLPLP